MVLAQTQVKYVDRGNGAVRRSIVEFIAARALAGNKRDIQYIIDYFSGMRPVDIAVKYSVPKWKVRHIINGLQTKVGGSKHLIGQESFILHVAKELVQFKPIVIDGRCIVCGAEVRKPIVHIVSSHIDIITRIVEDILDGHSKTP